MNLVKRTLVAALAVAFTGTAAQSAPVSPKLEEALREVSGNETVRIVVHMKDQRSTSFGATLSAGDQDARTRRIRLLKENAADSQRGLLNSVRPFGVMNGAVGDGVKSFWLANAVSLDASREMIAQIAARDDVAGVYFNETIPAPKVERSPIKPTPGAYTWGLNRIRIPEVHKLYGLKGAGVRVGHLDTGIAAEHPDLTGKVLSFKDFSGDGAAPYDDGGHGSHTAGTIAGGNASGKQIGVAPEAGLIVAKIFGPEGATLEGILGAMDWVVDPDGNPETDDGAQIVSNSWGSDNSTNRVFWDSVKKWVDLGVFPSFAGGNNGPNTVGTPGGFPHSFAVGSTDPDDALSGFSSRGPVTWDGQELVKPDIAAPGSGVLSAWHTGNGYSAIQGTSMACPHVSGVVALLLQANPNLTVDRIREILESSAEDKGDAGKDNLFGSGIMNAWEAVAQVVPSGKYEFTVTDMDGSAVNAEVTLTEQDVSFTTGDDGLHTVTLPAGEYKFSVRAFGFQPQTFEHRVEAGQASVAQLKLTKAEQGTLAGRVVDSAGAPLKATLSFPGTGLADAESSADSGAFEVQVPRGQYTMVVKSFGHEPKVINQVMVGAETQDMEIVLENLPPILVVDDDHYDRLESYFTASLDRLGKKYSVWDTRTAGDLPSDVIVQYPVVVWQTGFDYQTAFTSAEQAVVKGYLATGGHMFLSSQLAAVNLRQSPAFAEIFHAKFVNLIRADESNPVPTILGVAGDPVTDGLSLTLNGEGTQDNQNYPSILQPADDKATIAFNYEGETRGGGALRVEDGSAKLFYTAFGLEGIRGESARDGFFGKVLAYLAPTAQDAMARVEAVDAMRIRLLAERSADAVQMYQVEELLVAQAARALKSAKDGRKLLRQFAAKAAAKDAFAEVRRAMTGTR